MFTATMAGYKLTITIEGEGPVSSDWWLAGLIDRWLVEEGDLGARVALRAILSVGPGFYFFSRYLPCVKALAILAEGGRNESTD